MRKKTLTIILLLIILLSSGCTNQVEVTNFPVQYNDVFVKINIYDLDEGEIRCYNGYEYYKGKYHIYFLPMSIQHPVPVFEKKTIKKGETRYNIQITKYKNIISEIYLPNISKSGDNLLRFMNRIEKDKYVSCTGKIKGKANIIYSDEGYIDNRTVIISRKVKCYSLNEEFFVDQVRTDFYKYQINLVESIRQELIEEVTN